MIPPTEDLPFKSNRGSCSQSAYLSRCSSPLEPNGAMSPSLLMQWSHSLPVGQSSLSAKSPNEVLFINSDVPYDGRIAGPYLVSILTISMPLLMAEGPPSITEASVTL